MYVCVTGYVCMYVCMNVYVCVSGYVCMYVCMNVYVWQTHAAFSNTATSEAPTLEDTQGRDMRGGAGVLVAAIERKAEEKQVCTCIRTCICRDTHTCMHIVHTHTCMHVVHAHTCMQTSICTQTLIACVHLYMHTCTHVLTYHKQIHTLRHHPLSHVNLTHILAAPLLCVTPENHQNRGSSQDRSSGNQGADGLR